jgi:hypothetical protein
MLPRGGYDDSADLFIFIKSFLLEQALKIEARHKVRNDLREILALNLIKTVSVRI